MSSDFVPCDFPTCYFFLVAKIVPSFCWLQFSFRGVGFSLTSSELLIERFNCWCRIYYWKNELTSSHCPFFPWGILICMEIFLVKWYTSSKLITYIGMVITTCISFWLIQMAVEVNTLRFCYWIFRSLHG